MSWTPIVDHERDVPLMNTRADFLGGGQSGWDETNREYWGKNIVDEGEDFCVTVEATCRELIPTKVDLFGDQFSLTYELRFNRYVAVKIGVGYEVTKYEDEWGLMILGVTTAMGFDYGSKGHSIEFANAGQNEMFEVMWSRDTDPLKEEG
jgi:hypothetical protein